MTTRDIRTSHETSVCDVCGRTLLRGEHAETYINGGARHSVCELCKGRALHEGWVREGTLPEYDDAEQGSERRRSLLGRLRHRRDGSLADERSLDEELSTPWEPPSVAPATSHPATPPAPEPAPDRAGRDGRGSRPRRSEVRAPRVRVPRSSRAPAEARASKEARDSREPRHVRAVPTRDEQKIVSAIDFFNTSEHRRTVSGVARSLGLPVVSVIPDGSRPSLVRLVVSWELCWYRYELDLSDEVPTVRVEAQGYELTALSERERLPNAAADEMGQLSLR